jgi:hypothetical protein
VKGFTNGFTLSPLLVVASGAPFTPTISGNAPIPAGFVSVSGGTGILAVGGTNRPPFFAPNSFQQPGTANVDFRIQKEFSIRENWKLLLSGDAFNLFNHTNFTGVDTQMYTICAAGPTCASTGLPASTNELAFNPHFGVPTSSSNSLIAQRQIQVGIRLNF